MKKMLDQDPRSPAGVKVAQQVFECMNGLYGEKYANLKHVLWQEGFKKGKHGDDHMLSQDLVIWPDSTMDQYIRDPHLRALREDRQKPYIRLRRRAESALK